VTLENWLTLPQDRVKRKEKLKQSIRREFTGIFTKGIANRLVKRQLKPVSRKAAKPAKKNLNPEL
jgi:hypothetical protein